MTNIKAIEQFRLDKMIDEVEINLSEEEYNNLLILMQNDHKTTVDWILWQMKTYRFTLEQTLIQYILL